MDFLENIDIDINTGILKNIDIDKICIDWNLAYQTGLIDSAKINTSLVMRRECMISTKDCPKSKRPSHGEE